MPISRLPDLEALHTLVIVTHGVCPYGAPERLFRLVVRLEVRFGLVDWHTHTSLFFKMASLQSLGRYLSCTRCAQATAKSSVHGGVSSRSYP